MCWFGTNTDIEAQRDAMAARDAALACANDASRAKDEFLAMLGHELRNPLSPVVNALEILEMRGVQSREHAVIHRQVTLLSRLVDDLLDVSRFAQGKVELRRAPIKIATAVIRAMEIEFVVELKALPVAVDAPGSSEDAALDGAGDDTCRGRILVVDDNQDAAEMLSDYLKGIGFDVRVAHDPVVAREAAREFHPEYGARRGTP